MNRKPRETKCREASCNNTVPDEGLTCRDCHEAMCDKWVASEIDKMDKHYQSRRVHGTKQDC